MSMRWCDLVKVYEAAASCLAPYRIPRPVAMMGLIGIPFVDVENVIKGYRLSSQMFGVVNCAALRIEVGSYALRLCINLSVCT